MAKKSKNLLNSVPSFRLIILVLILIAVSGLYIGMQYKSKNMSSSKQCKVFDENQIMDFIYTKYLVKEGDTMLSIAQNQLGSSSRIADIIYVNMNNYPGLSIQNSYIEPGWVLYLPRPFIKKIHVSDVKYASYQLPTVISAEVVKIDSENSWMVTWGKGARGSITISTNTPFIGKAKSEYRIGDCVSVVEGASTGEVYGIFSQ